MAEPPNTRSGDEDRAPTGSAGAGEPGSDLSHRLERLNDALDKARPKGQTKQADPLGDTSAKSGMALAYRLGAEFVSAVLVGAALGYGLDYVAGISPWGMIVFLLIGFAAGVLNMMRASGELAKRKTPGS